MHQLQNFGDIHVSRAISGVGINGISVSSFSFRTTDNADIISSGIAAPVVVGGIFGLPTFYIDRRSYNDGVWTIESLDRCAFLDVPIKGLVASDGKYLMSAVFDRMEVDCGCSVSAPSGLPTYIEQEKIDGQTYQSVLQSISEALCGFWCSHYTNDIEFVPYNQSQSGEAVTDYSKIHDNGDFSYSAVYVSNGKNSQTYGSSKPELKIYNDFVDITNASLYNGIVGTTFKGWSVDRAIIPSASLPLVGGYITMNSTNYRITKVSGYVAGNSLVVSAGGDIPQYGEINRRGLLQQRLDDAVSTNKTYGAIKPTNDKDLGFVATPNK